MDFYPLYELFRSLTDLLQNLSRTSRHRLAQFNLAWTCNATAISIGFPVAAVRLLWWSWISESSRCCVINRRKIGYFCHLDHFYIYSIFPSIRQFDLGPCLTTVSFVTWIRFHIARKKKFHFWLTMEFISTRMTLFFCWYEQM